MLFAIPSASFGCINAMLHQTFLFLGQLWHLFEVSQILEFLRVVLKLLFKPVCVEESPSICPFLKNNGDEAMKGPSSVVFQVLTDTRTFSDSPT